MITIHMHKGGKGFYIEGHANYDEKGKDIICAAVSTIVQLAIMGLSKLANQYPNHIQIK